MSANIEEFKGEVALTYYFEVSSRLALNARSRIGQRVCRNDAGAPSPGEVRTQ